MHRVTFSLHSSPTSCVKYSSNLRRQHWILRMIPVLSSADIGNKLINFWDYNYKVWTHIMSNTHLNLKLTPHGWKLIIGEDNRSISMETQRPSRRSGPVSSAPGWCSGILLPSRLELCKHTGNLEWNIFPGVFQFKPVVSSVKLLAWIHKKISKWNIYKMNRNLFPSSLMHFFSRLV